MSMAHLRDKLYEAGCGNVRTFLATGNVLFDVSESIAESTIRQKVRNVVEGFGLDNDVFMRTADDIGSVLIRNPFPDAAADRPNHLLVLFMDRFVDSLAQDKLASYKGPERWQISDREIFIDYRDGVGRSKLTAQRLERMIGQAGTARNINTCRKIVDACAG